MRDLYWVLLAIGVIVAFTGFLIWMSWRFPNVYSYEYDWGRQVCTVIKPEKSFNRRMNCEEVEL